MKRKYSSMVVAGLCIAFLTGCQETPEDAIVRQKGADSVKSYESAKENAQAGTSLRELLGAPEHYANNASYEGGGLVIDTDADVILPEADTISTYAVTAMEVNQDMIDTVTNAFFDDAKFYSSHTYDQWTKQDYQDDINRLKKYKSEGNLDPYEHGTDENGQPQFNIDELIARDEEDMRTAPDEITKEEVKPSFGLEYWDGKGEERVKDVDEDCFFGVVETAQGNYDYMISYGLAPDISFKISKDKDDIVADPREFAEWIETSYLLGGEENGEIRLTEDDVKGMLDISMEDAQKIAEEKVEKLGWGLEVYNWDYAVFHHGEGGARKESILEAGYLFHFTRKVDEIPVTYTDEYGGGLEDMDSTLTPWSYERCDVIVGKDGIEKVEIYNPYEVGAVQTEHVKLMDFDSIAKIYEQMMEVSNADITKYETNRTYHIKRIVLGYSRIYDPTTDSDSGLLVPVWDFIGGFDSKNEEYEGTNNGEYSNRSFMTINAIDGTVIDRGLGY